jgi:ferritin-like protein
MSQQLEKDLQEKSLKFFNTCTVLESKLKERKDLKKDLQTINIVSEFSFSSDELKCKFQTFHNEQKDILKAAVGSLDEDITAIQELVEDLTKEVETMEAELNKSLLEEEKVLEEHIVSLLSKLQSKRNKRKTLEYCI